MIEIEELGKQDLPRWLAVSNAVRPSDPLTPAMMVDWCGQADSMIWLVATIDGVDAAVGHGVIGWHAEPGICQLEVSVLKTVV